MSRPSIEPHEAPGRKSVDAVKPQAVQLPPAPSYPTGLKFGMILFALFISLFCVALDSTIIATAIPKITDQFHALQDVGWYGSSYLLTKCGMYWPPWKHDLVLLWTVANMSQHSNYLSAKRFVSSVSNGLSWPPCSSLRSAPSSALLLNLQQCSS